MISQRELYGLARDVERAADLVQKDRPNTARELLLSVTERLWDAAFEPQSLTPMVGAEGGAGCSAVNQTEPGPVVGGSPARASLEAPPYGWREVEPMVLLTQRGLTLTRVTLREGEPAAEYNVGDGWKPTPAEYAPGAWLVRKRDSGVISPAKASDESEAST